MSLTGKWINEYQSVMTLQQDPVTGFVAGDYVSSTGSSGRYFVLGYASPLLPPLPLGQPVALSIYWRSYTGGDPDESWHWVSGLGGQLHVAPGAEEITLTHALVATTELNVPGLYVPPGTWVDKLRYVPDNNPEPIPIPTEMGGVADPIYGLWRCLDPFAELEIHEASPPHFFGAVEGLLALNGGPGFAVVGFTDIDAGPQKKPREGLSVSGFDGPNNRCLALAGSLDFSSDTLTLTVYATRATPPNQLYVQTTVEVWKFTRL